MSNGSRQTPQYNELLRALNEATYPTPPNLKIATKRSKHSSRFAERIQKNAELADQLIDVVKALNKKPGTEAQVDELIDIAKELLENNAKLREQVGEALQDIPN